MDLLAEIAAERLAVAEMLDSLTDEQWSTPSLAAGWTVKNVIAHLAMEWNYSIPKVAWRMLKARGNFDKVADQIAKADGAKYTTRQLADQVRSNLTHPFKPPGAGFEAPLSDWTIHGLDIRRPLGIEREIPADRLRVVLDTGVGPKARKFFGNDISGVRYSTSDMEWSHGDGPQVTGPAQDVALFLAGRRAGLDRLTGEGVATLQARG